MKKHMQKIARILTAALTASGLMIAPLMAASISTSFTNSNGQVSSLLAVRSGESFSYSFSGSFVGTLYIEGSDDGGNSFNPVDFATAPLVGLTASGSILVYTPAGRLRNYRVRCYSTTSGTATVVIANADNLDKTFTDRNGNTILSLYDNGGVFGGYLSAASLASSSAAFSGSIPLALSSTSANAVFLYDYGPRTSSELQTLTPAHIGDRATNVTIFTGVFSSGTSRGAWVLPKSTSTTRTPELAGY